MDISIKKKMSVKLTEEERKHLEQAAVILTGIGEELEEKGLELDVNLHDRLTTADDLFRICDFFDDIIESALENLPAEERAE